MKLSFSNCRMIEALGDGDSPTSAYHDAMRVEKRIEGASESGASRRLVIVSELSEIDERQLVACVGAGSEVSFTAKELYSPDFVERGGDCSWIGESVECPIEWWDVVDDSGTPRYQVWLYRADSGRILEAGTTREVAMINQCALWCEEDMVLWKALAEAHLEVGEKYPDSELAGMFFNIVGTCPHCDFSFDIKGAPPERVDCPQCKTTFDPISKTVV